MAQSSRYISEVFIPIKKDSQSFEERQRNIWEDMHERMERRRREWEDEVDSMRKDFFRLKPSETRRDSSENLLDTMDLNSIFSDDPRRGGGGAGDKRFGVSFDVAQFKPDEINVRTHDQKLIVYAKHEEQGGGHNVCKEFSRQIDIPDHVDPERLQCTLSTDGILQIEAPVSAPAYEQIRSSAAAAHGGFDQVKTAAALPSLQMSFQGPGGVGGGSFINVSSPSFPATALPRSSTMMEPYEGGNGYRIVLDIGTGFTPQDLTVKTVDRKLIVKARHEEKAPGRTSCKEFSRELDLPDHVDPNQVTASMTEEGRLLIEAPVDRSQQQQQGIQYGGYMTDNKPTAYAQPQVTISFRK